MMKNLGKIYVGWCLCAMAACQPATQMYEQVIAPDSGIEADVESLLGKMTLKEKIGQMTQLTLDVVGKGDGMNSFMPFELDSVMIDSIFRVYKVGSVLNTASNTPLTVERWAEVVVDLQRKCLKETGIPLIYGVDEIHGATYTVGATLFPQEIAMGATFNPTLVRRAAEISAYETRAGSIPWSFSPVLDLGRDARWPRMWETYGEDAYLASVMGEQSVLGYQGDDPNRISSHRVAACLKHFMGYGVPVSGKDRTPSAISSQDMRERHFAPFLRALRAGALSVMVNSGINNGVPFHADGLYLTKWLKEDLGWDGVLLTDWADIINLYQRDHVAASYKEAVAVAVNAGIDMSMVPYDMEFCVYLEELVNEGRVSMARINDAVRRILRMKHRLNLFEAPYDKTSDYPAFADVKHAVMARQSAAEAVTLLKNGNNILPLDKRARILVAGPNANSMRTLNGGWTLSWQGEKTDQYTDSYNTILEAMQLHFGTSNVVYEPGVTYNMQGAYYEEEKPQIEKAVAAARSVDYIVLCLGENSYCEANGNLDDLTLSENQLRLAEALAATRKPVILVLNEGRPRIISRIEPLMAAILQIYLPGNYGADALADVLTGSVNPSGRLPYTYPKHVNSLTTYDHKPSESASSSEQWPFGFGLSYTTFGYKNLRVSDSHFTASDTLTVTIDVTNTGIREGKEAVMLFTSDKVASVTPDVRRLRAFRKITLLPGETNSLSFRLPISDLAFVGADGKWTLEKGAFQIQIGNQTLDIYCDKTFKWAFPNI